jgi:hypothetical protein
MMNSLLRLLYDEHALIRSLSTYQLLYDSKVSDHLNRPTIPVALCTVPRIDPYGGGVRNDSLSRYQ